MDSFSLMLSSFGSLCAILLILAGGAFLLRRMRNMNWGDRKEPSLQINIVASRRLGMHNMLLVAEISGVHVLLGTGRNGVSSIVHLRETLSGGMDITADERKHS